MWNDVCSWALELSLQFWETKHFWTVLILVKWRKIFGFQRKLSWPICELIHLKMLHTRFTYFKIHKWFQLLFNTNKVNLFSCVHHAIEIGPCRIASIDFKISLTRIAYWLLNILSCFRLPRANITGYVQLWQLFKLMKSSITIDLTLLC